MSSGADQNFLDKDQAEAVLKSEPENLEAHRALAIIHTQYNNYDVAIAHLKRALKVEPQQADLCYDLARLFLASGYEEEGVTQLLLLEKLEEGRPRALWCLMLRISPIYLSQEHLAASRKEWLKRCQSLSNLVASDKDHRADYMECVLSYNPFYLAYSGGYLLEEQACYAQMVESVVKTTFPQGQKGASQAAGTKFRVAFVSEFFFDHSISHTHGAWVTELDRIRFEVHVIYLGNPKDETTQAIEDSADHFIYAKGLPFEQLIESIRGMDTIIYPDLGMNPASYALAALRLAPLQCVALGHPVTTGLSEVDYMLSSELMEPKNAQKQYTEKLVCLPNLSVSYPEPDVACAEAPPSWKEEYAESVNYLNVQSLFKLLPAYDHIYPEIALREPNSRFHFIAFQGRTKLSFDLFNRVAGKFTEKGLDPNRYLVLHPRLTISQLYGLFQKGQVLLDSIEWSGFNTSMEASAFSLPLVTLPGETTRSRHSYAILKRMGLEELIAHDLEDYISIAVRLGSESEWRAELSAAIAKKKHLLYNDKTVIRALEDWLLAKEK
jgi:protein O-GlcNAc transferase